MLQIQVLPDADPVACAMAAQIEFQPIVSTASLRAHGFEALARLPPGAPFRQVEDLLDAAHRQDRLLDVERSLAFTALDRFVAYSGAAEARLFCNVDMRIFEDPRLNLSNVIVHARELGLAPANLCLEMSERAPPRSPEGVARLTRLLAGHNVRIAIDDFGRGVSGLQSLLTINPHYIKIDRLFIEGIARSARQQAIVGKVVGLGHSLGLLTVAEGVETEADFRLLREMGCDFIQGPLVALPCPATELKPDYSTSFTAPSRTTRIPARISELLVSCEPLSVDDTLGAAVARFRKGVKLGFVPVVDRGGQVLGAMYEEDVQTYLYSEYAAALLKNAGLDHRLDSYVRRCPISEATASPEAIVESFLVASGAKGLVLTLDGKLAGLLSSQSVLQLSWERAVEEARDRNPLTALPGNKSIGEHLDFIVRVPQPRTLVFFDFDNFKCFNDVYGFAKGDRAILDFARVLVELRHSHNAFVGHVGGDDFFASLPLDEPATSELVTGMLHRFRIMAEAHYTPEHRAAGGMWTQDRFGEQRFFPLLRASAAVLELPDSRSHATPAKIIAALAGGKSNAKSSVNGIHAVDFPPTAIAEAVEEAGEWSRSPAVTAAAPAG